MVFSGRVFFANTRRQWLMGWQDIAARNAFTPLHLDSSTLCAVLRRSERRRGIADSFLGRTCLRLRRDSPAESVGHPLRLLHGDDWLALQGCYCFGDIVDGHVTGDMRLADSGCHYEPDFAMLKFFVASDCLHYCVAIYCARQFRRQLQMAE